MEKDPIKEAFSKVKDDISSLKEALNRLTKEIEEIKRSLEQNIDAKSNNQTVRQTLRHINTTETYHSDTKSDIPAHLSTDNLPLEAPKSQISYSSIGNRGVSTDSQTDRQSDISTGNRGVKVRLNNINTVKTHKLEHMAEVSKLLDSLDDIKKDLRHKIKRLTNQEMEVFSTIYELEEKGFTVDYSLIAEHLSLTESSIRDYIQRLLKKGIPIGKTKENNKRILLYIPENFKKIATFQTILQLREL